MNPVFRVRMAADNVLSAAFCMENRTCKQKAGPKWACFLLFLFFEKGKMTMSILEIEGLSHAFGDRVLYQNASFVLNKGEHVGVVGPNGCGKSTLLKIAAGTLLPDAGRVHWQPQVQIGVLDQHAVVKQSLTLGDFLRSAFTPLYQIEQEMLALYTQMAEGALDESALLQAANAQEALENGDFYNIDTRVEQVARGLGLHALGMTRTLATLSGGQRAKAILAKLLLAQPDVLLLDEPTNFLDKEHVDWLAAFLQQFNGAFLVVSHDDAFLERVTNRICDIDNRQIRKYHGSYTAFLEKKAFLRDDYLRRVAAQEREIKRTEAFIRKNIAGRHAKMARGRQKQLDRMERLEPLQQQEAHPCFCFQALPFTGAEHLVVSQLAVGYTHPVLRGIDFSIQGGQKVVLTGFNGVGKSTLLKTLTGALPALDGRFRLAEQVRLGYFAQDLRWPIGTQTPLDIVCAQFPQMPQKIARRHLAQCGLAGERALQAIATLSGGEQAKVKLCLLTLTPCNFLILDEPTNHLDAFAKDALRQALIDFPGSVLLVSHEEAFYRGWVQKEVRVGC